MSVSENVLYRRVYQEVYQESVLYHRVYQNVCFQKVSQGKCIINSIRTFIITDCLKREGSESRGA